MKYELTKWSLDKAVKVLGDARGKTIVINDTYLIGVESINFEEEVIFDSDPIPEEGYDGGRTVFLKTIFSFNSGHVSRSFCPDTDICHFWYEMDDLICFSIKKIPDYVENEKFDLDYKLKEYEKYMSR